MKLLIATALLVGIASASPIQAPSTEPCCVGTCNATAGYEKYWSIASGIFGDKHCGECCMKPSDYKLYHFFEKNLTKSESDFPCKGFGYTKYDSTVTHGFGPVKMTLDLYDEPSAAGAAAPLDTCPGSSSWVHAKTSVTATFTDSCDSVMSEVTARAKGSSTGAWTDPHNKGVYTIAGSDASTISLSHLTGNKKYTDKVKLTFSSAANGGCTLQACSESQVFSVLDMSTNYCNIHDLYCSDEQCHVLNNKLTYTEDISASSGQHDTSNCYLV